MEKKDYLELTGNWYEDGGIIGFIKIMENTYGWDLKTLKKKIENEEEKVYYGYFPFAYFTSFLSEKYKKKVERRTKKLVKKLEKKNFENKQKLLDFVWFKYICVAWKYEWIEKKLEINKEKNKKKEQGPEKYKKEMEGIIKLIDELQNDLKEIKYNEKKLGKKKISYLKIKKILQEIKEKCSGIEIKIENEKEMGERIKEKCSEIEIKIENLKSFLKDEWKKVIKANQEVLNDSFYRIPIDSGFYKNFLFFNNNSNQLTQKKYLLDLINFDLQNSKLKIIDKTINKFLPSQEEFKNINYTELSAKEFKEKNKYFAVYFACFIFAFERYGEENIFFYSYDLELCIKVNKRIRLQKQKIKEQKEVSIFNIAWQEIFDTLVEYKSSWSLENMYIISYKKLDNKNQEGVEYIGVPKIQAEMLLDDEIREGLNINIALKSEKEVKKFTLINEFVVGNPLYPIILKYVNSIFSKEERIKDYHNLLISLIVEAHIKKIREKNKGALFTENFFVNYKPLLSEIKRDIRETSFNASLITKIGENRDSKENREEKTKLAKSLYNSLKAYDKNHFLNTLLNHLNKTKELSKNKNFIDWVFEKIIKNKKCFEIYGLILILNIMR
ncbi:MAG: hypothetical protein QXH71_02090 [Candidatus Anstonellaceae archaeon]